jgi:uncharacterized membrane protein
VPKAAIGIFQLAQEVSGPIHFGCAGAFFVLLALNSIFLFTLSDKKVVGEAKRDRNIVYVVCGVVILACLAAFLTLYLVAKGFLDGGSMALALEAIMLLAFGFAWLVKSDIGLFRDRVSVPKRRSTISRRG